MIPDTDRLTDRELIDLHKRLSPLAYAPSGEITPTQRRWLLELTDDIEAELEHRIAAWDDILASARALVNDATGREMRTPLRCTDLRPG